MNKIETKKYIVYFAVFFGGLLFFSAIPFLVFYLFFIFLQLAGDISIMVLSFATIVILYGLVLLVFRMIGKKEFYIGLASFFIAIFAVSFFVYINIGRTPDHRDTKRISDIRQLEISLLLYHDDNGSYPPAIKGCRDLSNIEAFLVPRYLPNIPRDRSEEEGNLPYQYAVSQDQTRYVLKATLLSEQNLILERDTDGDILGCDCNDPNLCVVNE